MKIYLLGALVGFLLTGCICGPCYDCCQPADPGMPLAVSCRVVRPDAGPIPDVAVACGGSDGGAVTDSNGAFAFTVRQVTCGSATGSTDCSYVTFTLDGGPLTVFGPSADGGAVASLTVPRLIGSNCHVFAAP